MCQVVGLPTLCSNSYKPITNTAWVRAWLFKLQKGCTRLTAASDQVYQLLAHGRWFSPGTLASSTTKTGRHDIAEILLKVALKHQKSKSIIILMSFYKCLDESPVIGGVLHVSLHGVIILFFCLTEMTVFDKSLLLYFIIFLISPHLL